MSAAVEASPQEMRPEELRGSVGTYRLRQESTARASLAASPGKVAAAGAPARVPNQAEAALVGFDGGAAPEDRRTGMERIISPGHGRGAGRAGDEPLRSDGTPAVQPDRAGPGPGRQRAAPLRRGDAARGQGWSARDPRRGADRGRNAATAVRRGRAELEQLMQEFNDSARPAGNGAERLHSAAKATAALDVMQPGRARQAAAQPATLRTRSATVPPAPAG